MNKKERVDAAVRGKPVDRVPAMFSLHFLEKDYFGKNAIEAHRSFYKETDVDILKVMNENKFTTDVSISVPGDWKKVRPITGKEPFVQDQIDIIKALADEFGDETYLFTTIHGAFASAFHATNDKDGNLAHGDKVTAHLKEKPEDVEPALRLIAESIALFTQLALEAGSHGIYYAALGAEKYRFSKEMYNQYIKPNDLIILEAAKQAPAGTILHMCKDQLNIEVYKDYPGEIVNWAVHEQNIGLTEGKELFNRTVLGGFDDRSGLLVDGTKEAIEAEIGAIIEEMGTEQFILGADCTLPTDISYERIRWVTDSLKSMEQTGKFAVFSK